jgi:hypothetical protein
MTKIIVNNQICLDLPSMADLNDYVVYLNEPEIYDNTLQLPSPYLRQHAIDWMEKELEFI